VNEYGPAKTGKDPSDIPQFLNPAFFLNYLKGDKHNIPFMT